VRNDRTALPLMPFIYLLAASVLVRMAKWVVAHPLPRRRMAAGAVAVGVFFALSIAYPVVATVATTNSLLERVESREIARKWVEENVPAGSHVALESYAPYVDPAKYKVESLIVLIDHDAQWYRDNGVEYLLFSEGSYGRFFEDTVRNAQAVAEYNALFSSFEEVKTVSVGWYEVRIFRVPTQ